MDHNQKKFICNICHKGYARAYTLSRHQEQIHSRDEKDDSHKYVDKNPSPFKKIWPCTICGQQLCSKISLAYHMEKKCGKLNNTTDNLDELKCAIKNELIKELKGEFRAENHTSTNNLLQVICVTSTDNYLDMLTNKIGDFSKAIDYIKDCALSDVTGDCKLIEKIYFDSDIQYARRPISYVDKKKTRIRYNNETEEIVESKEIFARKLANNLQNSYLKSINYLINRNLESRGCPNKFLETYDMIAWNAHIYKLMDDHYRNKMINNIDIPIDKY
jgi:hypothetical protein